MYLQVTPRHVALNSARALPEPGRGRVTCFDHNCPGNELIIPMITRVGTSLPA